MHGNVSYYGKNSAFYDFLFQIKRKYVFGMKLTMVKHKTAEFVLLSMQLILINLLSIGLH